MKMKYAKVALACLLAMSMSFGVCGCDDKPGSESKIPVETMSPEDAKVGLTFEFDNNGPAVENTENSDSSQSGSAADSVTSSGSDSSAAETVYEEVTEYVPVTDAEGQNVTEAGGAVQTQVVVVETRPVTVTQPAGQDSSGSDSSSGGDSSTGGNSSTGGDSSSGSDSSSGDDPSSGGSGELDLLARLISAEARGEPYEGQVAVGAVVLNRLWHLPCLLARQHERYVLQRRISPVHL